MKRAIHVMAFVSAMLLSGIVIGGQTPEPGAAAPATSARAMLPKDIVWETNNDDPPIGSPKALRGGTFNYFMSAYPLTFRLVGPNSNDGFAGWNRLFTMNFALVTRHPVTDRFIPMMATDWSVQDDQRTIYFKLDRDARFSDGMPVTADDYVFTWKMMLSDYIVDPFYVSYARQYFESVDKIDGLHVAHRGDASELAPPLRLCRPVAYACARRGARQGLGYTDQ